MGGVPRQRFLRSMGVVAFGHLRFEMSKSSAAGPVASAVSEALEERGIRSVGCNEDRTDDSIVFTFPFGWTRTYSTVDLLVLFGT